MYLIHGVYQGKFGITLQDKKVHIDASKGKYAEHIHDQNDIRELSDSVLNAHHSVLEEFLLK